MLVVVVTTESPLKKKKKILFNIVHFIVKSSQNTYNKQEL